MPLAILKNLDDRDFLAQIEAVDHFMDNMIAYSGRTFGQIYHRSFRSNDLAEGSVNLDRYWWPSRCDHREGSSAYDVGLHRRLLAKQTLVA